MKSTGLDLRVPPAAVIDSVSDAYDRSQYLEAFKLAESFAPLQQWDSPQACTIASRLAANLGAPRLARKLSVRMWRTDSSHPLSQFEYGYQSFQLRGPLRLWHEMAKWPATAVVGPDHWRADLLALKSMIAANLRDFDTAEKFQSQAEQLAIKTSWVRLQRAHLFEHLDEVERALETAQATVHDHPHPHYRSGIQSCAHFLQLLDRDEDAIELLQNTSQHIQSGAIVIQLYGLLTENGRWSEASEALDRFVQSSPLIEKDYQKWLTSQRARTAYFLGRRSDAVSFARAAGDDFNLAFAKKLEAPADGTERVRLEVPFVRQHFKTCAPATQAALGRFWKLPADHLKLVEAVCYDGTPSWKQRDWSEQNGWVVREFRVTWENARQLLTRGIPFAVSTVEAKSAHMQAVMGFNQTRDVLYLRDPNQPYAIEWPAERFFKRYRPFGPQGMVFLPKSEASRLDGVDLTDSEIHDFNHAFQKALASFDRTGASAALAQLSAQYPDHDVTWDLRGQLASYDANHIENIRCLDRLLELFPNNPARILQRHAVMRSESREDQIIFLKRACDEKEADPTLFFDLGRLLAFDARKLEEAKHWLKRGLRFRPTDSSGATVMAMIQWNENRYLEATESYRFAATLENFREPAYQDWFIACRQIRQTAQALQHLKDRFKRFGARSAQPACTLAWALQELEQPQEAMSVLSEAINLRPDDAYLLLRLATLEARLNKPEQSRARLEEAKGKVREVDRLRAAAEVAEISLNTVEALGYARKILIQEPLALDAHNGVARCLANLEGKHAAIDHLAQACAAQPDNCGIRRVYIDWLRSNNFQSVISTADEILRLSPGDAWTRRERASALANLNQLPKALAEAEESTRIEPGNSYSQSLVARIHMMLREPEKARSYLRRAITLSVDNSQAIRELLALATDDQARRSELTLIQNELKRQVVSGDGLLAFGEVARPLLAPPEILTIFREAHAERPELWQSWMALTEQLCHMGNISEALEVAIKASERFPHIPRVWHELSGIYQKQNAPADEINTAQRAFDINPAWNQSAYVLAQALERHRTLEDARQVYSRALHHLPKDPMMHAQIGFILWRQQQPEAAMARMESALQLMPDYGWAWNHLYTWANQCGTPERIINVSKELTRQRPGDPVVWIMFARTLQGPETFSERHAAVERAIQLDPHSIDNWDFMMELLVEDENYDEAIKSGNQGLIACSSRQFMLRGRLAWIDAQRGKISDAIATMRSILTENSGYVWGWQQLSVWLVHLKEYADAETAIEKILKLEPDNQWALRQMAYVRMNRDDHQGAEKVYANVLRKSPADQNAAVTLYDLQMETGNLGGAAATLAQLKTHHPGAHTSCLEIKLLLRQKDLAAAQNRFEGLIRNPDPNPWPIGAAFEAFKTSRHALKAMKLLKHGLLEAGVNPHAGEVAMKYLLGEKKGLRALWLLGRIRSDKARLAAATVFAETLGRINDSILLQLLLWRHQKFLRQHDSSWGKVGYALASHKKMRRTVAWMKDWQTRSNIEPWMLFNLCYALRQLGSYPESDVVVKHAIDRWGHRHQNTADLRLFLAVEQAIAGDTMKADENLRQARIRDKVIYDRQLQAITKALIHFQQIEISQRPKRFKEVRKILNDQIDNHLLINGDADVRRTFRRAGKSMAKSGAGWKAKVWLNWKSNWTLLFILVAPLGILLAIQPAFAFLLIVFSFLGYYLYRVFRYS